MQRTITIHIRPDGQTTLRTDGFTGNSCQQATKKLQQALGLTQSEQLTSEYYRTNSQRLLKQSESE